METRVFTCKWQRNFKISSTPSTLAWPPKYTCHEPQDQKDTQLDLVNNLESPKYPFSALQLAPPHQNHCPGRHQQLGTDVHGTALSKHGRASWTFTRRYTGTPVRPQYQQVIKKLEWSSSLTRCPPKLVFGVAAETRVRIPALAHSFIVFSCFWLDADRVLKLPFLL